MAEKLAVLGGSPVRTEPYPSWPVFDERDVQAVTDVVRSGRWGGYPYPGPRNAQLVERFLAMQGGRYAVTAANGTVTLEIALRAAGIGWGDEVIVPGYTFAATATGVMAAGAIPVIVDIDPETYCIAPKAIEVAITGRTKAIVPVHLGAQMADMDAIMAIAERHGLLVLEDCAHAHGARWREQGAGTFGHFGSFSFQTSKSITTGEGAILLCRTSELAHTAASIMDYGRPQDPAGEHYTMGANFRMTEFQAALAIVALERFPEQVRARIAMLDYLEEGLSEVSGVRLLKRDMRHTTRSFYRYIFAIDPEAFGADRYVVTYALMKEGIPAKYGYPPMHRYNLFQPGLSKLPVPSAFPEYFDFENMHLPESERAGEREAIWLDHPLFAAGQKGIDDAVAAIQKVQANASGLSAATERLLAEIDPG
jgi:dTDP-4-amino-4,6-dideoxygalactose transaminase